MARPQLERTEHGTPLRYSPSRPVRRARGVGYWAFLLNRISGLVLAGYLVIHLANLSMLYRGEAAYNAFLAVVSQPVFLWLDVALAAAAIYHGFNGVRLTAVGLGVGVRRQAGWFWAVFVLGLVALFFMGRRMLAGG